MDQLALYIYNTLAKLGFPEEHLDEAVKSLYQLIFTSTVKQILTHDVAEELIQATVDNNVSTINRILGQVNKIEFQTGLISNLSKELEGFITEYLETLDPEDRKIVLTNLAKIAQEESSKQNTNPSAQEQLDELANRN